MPVLTLGTPPTGTPPVNRSRLSMRLQTPTPTSSPQLLASPHLDVSTNDDTTERLNRMKARQENRGDNRYAGISQEKIQEFSEVYKKLIDSKLNQENAFNIHIIDCMDELVRREARELNDFAHAGLMVDNCTKVYSYRVDAIYDNFQTIAAGISKQQRQRKNNNEEDDDDEDEEGTSKKKKRKRVRKGTAIEDSKNLNYKLELKPEIDCYFHKSQASTENVYNGGLLLMSLDVDGEGRLLMDGEAPVFPRDPKLQLNGELVDACFLDEYLSIAEQDDVEMCPSFEFEWENDWRPKNNSTLEVLPESGFDYDPDAELDNDKEDENEVVFSDMGIDDSDLANNTAVTLGTVGHDAQDADNVSRELMRSQLAPSMLMHHVSLAHRDYGFICPKIVDVQMATNKLRPRLTDRISDPNAPAKPKKPKAALTFSVDSNNAMEKSEKAKSLTLRKKAEWEKQRTLNNDETSEGNGVTVEDICKLFSKRDFIINRFEEAAKEEVDDEIQFKSDDLQNISSCCPAEDDVDDDVPGFPSDGVDAEAAEEEAQEGESQGEQLLEAPKKVAFVRLDVPKLNKKMDMVKLKETLWLILTKGENKATMEGSMSFTELYKIVPSHFIKISKEMTENLSVPLVMIALLHLTNEKGLYLSNVGEDMRDLMIQQGADKDVSEDDSSEDEAPEREMPGRSKKARKVNYAEEDEG